MKEKSGITLIALIITIIVMLILVAVTISMAINGGLFGYAGNAAKDTELAKQNELKLAEGSLEVDGKKYDSPEDFIEGVESGSAPKYSASLLNENGVLTTNAVYTDTNSNKSAEIPKGFGIVEDCDIIDNGLVISDGFDSNGNSIGNEFVWIPVVFTEEGDKDENGLDDGFEEVFYRSDWNNKVRYTNYTTSTTYVENATNDPTGKYNEMMQSVQNHKGFYIGRYETGEKENNKIVIKRDKKPYVNIAWGTSMTNIGSTGAVYLSRNMYSSADYGVTSTLCYGVQWDAMLDFVYDAYNRGNYGSGTTWTVNRQTAQYRDNSTWKLISNETGGQKTKAVYEYYLLTTGANEIFQAKNVFDFAGNVNEWTMEVKNNSKRVARGGFYGDDAQYNSPSIRYGDYAPSSYADTRGFRVALYISPNE